MLPHRATAAATGGRAPRNAPTSARPVCGLGQLAGRARKFARLAWVDHRHRNVRTSQFARQDNLQAAGRFHDDQRRTHRRQLGNQIADSRRVVRHPPLFARLVDGDVQVRLRDIHPQVHRSSLGHPRLHPAVCSPLARPCTIRAHPAPATVRAPAEAGPDDPARDGLFRPEESTAYLVHAPDPAVWFGRRRQDTRNLDRRGGAGSNIR